MWVRFWYIRMANLGRWRGFVIYGFGRLLLSGAHNGSLWARETGLVIDLGGSMARAATYADSATSSGNRIIIIITEVRYDLQSQTLFVVLRHRIEATGLYLASCLISWLSQLMLRIIRKH